MYEFRGTVAERYGVNAAVVAEYLYSGEDDLAEMELVGKNWYRCSARRIALMNPFLSVSMVKRAVRVLRDNGVIRSKKMKKSGFDHTNWYCFTDYGMELMRYGGEENEKDQ